MQTKWQDLASIPSEPHRAQGTISGGSGQGGGTSMRPGSTVGWDQSCGWPTVPSGLWLAGPGSHTSL